MSEIVPSGFAPEVISKIKEIVDQKRKNVAIAVNNELLSSYWQIGELIAEQSTEMTDKSARSFILSLSRVLTDEIGRGFSRSNLFNMRNFYLNYPDVQTVSGQLSWSHYCELIAVSDIDARNFYERECLNSRWSVRELSRQIDTALYQRLLLSDEGITRQKLTSLSREGHVIEKPDDIIKDPYVLEFLGLHGHKVKKERGLERKLLEHIEEFLLELGRGFMFVGSQQRVTINNVHYTVDMVFYNKLLKAYVLIDLKIGKMKLESGGQMNGYVNYYKTEVNAPDDNPPIGIILCADKDAIMAEYALGGLENHIFASKYTLLLPDKEQLIKQVEYVLAQAEDADENGEESQDGQDGHQ